MFIVCFCANYQHLTKQSFKRLFALYHPPSPEIYFTIRIKDITIILAMLTSASTPGLMLIVVIYLTISDDEYRSMTRLCRRIRK